MKYYISIALFCALFIATSNAFAQPATTAKTFRMYSDATHSVSITAGAAAGTGTFSWPQPATGIFKSDNTGVMSIGAINLASGDVTGVLSVTNGGTGSSTIGAAGSVPYSDGTKLVYSTVGTTGDLFVSNGSSGPVWTNTFPTSVSVPFNQISSGNNTSATMTVGSGASLAPTGSGTLTANQFVGSGSSTNAVDLATAEVSGTLAPANGGTGTTTAGAAGTVIFSNGTTYANTAVGAAGQILTSNGAGTPTWTTVIVAKATGRVQGDNTNFSYTITPGGGYSATSTVIVTLESTVNQSITVTAKTATTFTVQSPVVLTTSDFIGYVVY
jgi:hypothetical protein